MACLVQRKVVNPRYRKICPNGHYRLYGDRDDYYVPVDCGVCINCVNKYKSAWNYRLTKEFDYMSIEDLKKVYYVTLTMDPQFYFEDRKHISILVRRFLERYRKKFKCSIRHFLITERGDDEHGEHRIHMHGFLFGLDHPELIWQYWAYGFVKVKPLYGKDGINGEFIGYCTGYITAPVDDVLIDKFDKPMVFVSPGLGKKYADDPRNIHFHHQNDSLIPYAMSYDGKLRSLPRYLRQKVFTDNELKQLTDEYFVQISDDVVPDPPYYIGTQIFYDYSAYLNALKPIYKQYKDMYYG